MAEPGASRGGLRRPVRRTRRGRLLHRALPLIVLALGAFAAGIVVSRGAGQQERQLARRYVNRWAHGDLPGMYQLLAPRDRRALSFARFSRALERDAAVATLSAIRVVAVQRLRDGYVPVTMLVRTRIFGSLRELLRVPIVPTADGVGVHWSAELRFPGLRPGERLSRRSQLGPRGALLAVDDSALATGPGRVAADPVVAGEVVGRLGPPPPAAARSYVAAGYPAGAKVGLNGLERIFETRLAGVPGGTLLAGRRVLARSTPLPGEDVHTTIDPALQRAAVAAIGGRYASLAALDPRSGAVRALVGFAFSVAQPPGSTMKIITAAAALEAGLTSLGHSYPVSTEATIDGYTLQNANGEACGGTLLSAFATSCNSVFAPLGVKLGAVRLVAMAERFGFNAPAGIPGAAESTIPAAPQIGGALAVGSSAIGQGRVQATTLEMTEVAATIGMGGQRPLPTLLAGVPPRLVAALPPGVAAQVARMMVAVVASGTGTAAQVPGVVVAGKTGTAELRDTAAPPGTSPDPATQARYTDAWFVGYAPADHPVIAVGVLFPGQGAGGAVAAPVAGSVLGAALGRG